MKYDAVIIGGGPAGMSAALYAHRAMMKVALIEKAPMGGGQIINSECVDNYLGMPQTRGFDLAMAFYNHIGKIGVEIINSEVEKLSHLQDYNTIKLANGNEIVAKAVIMATGASYRMLGVTGEDKFKGRGVSYCATCDGGFFKGKTVAVIGGGDTAVYDALYLSAICQKVYLINRRDKLRASASAQEKMQVCNNIEFIPDTVVEQLCGDEVISHIDVCNAKNERKSINVDGVFVAIGMEPSNYLVKDIVETDESGYIVAGEDGRTSEASIFVAGDLRTKPLRQVSTAVADGAYAVKSVGEYLSSIEW